MHGQRQFNTIKKLREHQILFSKVTLKVGPHDCKHDIVYSVTLGMLHYPVKKTLNA